MNLIIVFSYIRIFYSVKPIYLPKKIEKTMF